MTQSRPDEHPRRYEISDGYVKVDSVRLKLAHPYTAPGQWIGQHEVLMQLLACWITVDDADLPLTPRSVGSPGSARLS